MFSGVSIIFWCFLRQFTWCHFPLFDFMFLAKDKNVPVRKISLEGFQSYGCESKPNGRVPFWGWESHPTIVFLKA